MPLHERVVGTGALSDAVDVTGHPHLPSVICAAEEKSTPVTIDGEALCRSQVELGAILREKLDGAIRFGDEEPRGPIGGSSGPPD